jgi:gluconokinase
LTPANVAKMASGVPLTDTVRAQWLAAVHERMRDAHLRGEHLVIACSALTS